MDDMNERLAKLGQQMAEISDAASDPAHSIGTARRRLLAAPSPPSRGGLHRRAQWVIAAGLAAACAVVLFVMNNRPSALSFDVGWPPERGAVGDWIAAAPQSPLPVRFSEGSVLTLAPGARMRVTEANAEGAGVLVEQGSVHAKIEHRGHRSRWMLRAGPFEVRVTGTVFDAKWDPAAEVFELSMKEGSVVASGPLLPSARAITAGEELVVSIHEQRTELRTAHGPLGSTPAVSPDQPPPVEPLPEAVALPADSSAANADPPHAGGSAGDSSAEPAPSAAPSWRALAAAGKYKDALESAERVGFSSEIGRASATDLFALADAARFAGSPARAREALLAARARFGARGRSAFLLGKIAADQQGAYGDAVNWFEIYLREEPQGSLAEQALGRILDIHRRGNPAAAQAAAERYLARYPNGAYADVARRTLSR